MPDLVSEGSEFSCNFCTSKLKLNVIHSSSNGDSKKLANQTNCLLLPPPGGQCTLLPGPPVPCVGALPGSVTSTGQSTVKIDGQAALGDGCQFLCPLGQPVSLSKSDQTVAKHDEASSSAEAYVAGGCLIIGGVILAVALLPEEVGAAVVVGVAAAAKAVGTVAVKTLKKVAGKTKNASKAKPKKEPAIKVNSNRTSSANDNYKTPANNNSAPAKSKTGTYDESLPQDPFKDPRYENISHPKAAERGHYQFKNKDTGEVVRFDKGKPGTPGHEGFDHYHRENPNRTSKLDHYLDGQGNPVPKGSDASHIYPK